MNDRSRQIIAQLAQLTNELSAELAPERLTDAQRSSYWYERAREAEAQRDELDRKLKQQTADVEQARVDGALWAFESQAQLAERHGLDDYAETVRKLGAEVVADTDSDEQDETAALVADARARIRREVLEELEEWLVALQKQHPRFEESLGMSRMHVQRFIGDERSS